MSTFKHVVKHYKLVDLLVVIAIIGVLSGLRLEIPGYRREFPSKKPTLSVAVKNKVPATIKSLEKDDCNPNTKPPPRGFKIDDLAADFSVEIAAGTLLLGASGVVGWISRTAGLLSAMRRYVRGIRRKYHSSTSVRARKQRRLCDAFEKTPTNHMDELVRICDRIEENEVRFRITREKSKSKSKSPPKA
jgi:hypothetical protein